MMSPAADDEMHPVLLGRRSVTEEEWSVDAYNSSGGDIGICSEEEKEEIKNGRRRRE